MHVSASCRAWNMGWLSGKSKVLVSICRTVSEPDFHQIIQKSRFLAFRSRLLAVRKTFFTSFVRFCAEKLFSLSRDWKIICLRLNVKYTVLECINSVYTVYLFILSRYPEAFFPVLFRWKYVFFISDWEWDKFLSHKKMRLRIRNKQNVASCCDLHNHPKNSFGCKGTIFNRG